MININVEDDVKSLIIAGDHQMLIDLLFQIKNEASLKQTKIVKPKTKTSEKGINIAAISETKSISDTENCLEFLLLTLSKSFSLQPNQVNIL